MTFQTDLMLASVHGADSADRATVLTDGTETPETISSVDDAGPSSVSDEKIIYNSSGAIVSGAADVLLCKMLPTSSHCPDNHTIFTLLVNLRAFISPADLLQKVLQHCMFEQNSKSDNFRKESRSKMFENMFHVCAEWTTSIPYDFREPAMRDRLLEIFGLCVIDDAALRKCDELMLNLRTTLSKLERYEVALRSLHQNIEDPPSTADQLVGLAVICPEPLVVAQQLAHIELERLGMIGVDEFAEILKSGQIENLCVDKNATKAANIRHYVEWFNQLTNLVATEILRHSRKRYRVKTIEYFIDVAKECINIGNFNSLMSIVAGLSLQPVARLKRTWARVEKSKLEILQHQLDPSGNFISYRATLKAAIWRSDGAKQDAERVIIPFFGLLMKDLYLLHHRCVMPLPNGHLNYAMFTQFADNLRNLLKWKSRPCPFKRNSQVLQYLLLAANYSETNMLRLSYDYEVAELSADKEQYKRIRELTKQQSS
uniref:Ras-GEF domain-containing protein n=1 Tax=Panagrellus redivivus TaxID=6233 RepID=A0A7E4ZZ79_PANRE